MYDPPNSRAFRVGAGTLRSNRQERRDEDASLAVLAVAAILLALSLGITTTVGQGPENGLDRAIAVQEEHSGQLLDTPGVVGTAVGHDAAGKVVIKVYTEEAVGGLPEKLGGVPVDVEVTGKIVALSCPLPYNRCARPVPIGVSTGHPSITAGTIGARVTNGASVFALSNNHVYANQNNALIGDNALQPGPYDGGVNPADAIGTLAAFEPLKFTASACNPSRTLSAACSAASA